tara:strand:- start:1241 stop:1510 length:270 start_codon:yes stop_codon:yes gene_type:complete
MSKKHPILKNLDQRKSEVKEVINSLYSLNLSQDYPPINNLYKIMFGYIKDGGKKNINIPFPMINKRIKGILPDTINEKCWIKLINEKIN